MARVFTKNGGLPHRKPVTPKWQAMRGWMSPVLNDVEEDCFAIDAWAKYKDTKGSIKLGEVDSCVQYSYGTESRCEEITDQEEFDQLCFLGYKPETKSDDCNVYDISQEINGVYITEDHLTAEIPEENQSTSCNDTAYGEGTYYEQTKATLCVPSTTSLSSSLGSSFTLPSPVAGRRSAPVSQNYRNMSMKSTQIPILPSELNKCPPVKLSLTHSAKSPRETSPAAVNEESLSHSSGDGDQSIGITSSGFIKALSEYKQVKSINGRENSVTPNAKAGKYEYGLNRAKSSLIESQERHSFVPKIVMLQNVTPSSSPSSRKNKQAAAFTVRKTESQGEGNGNILNPTVKDEFFHRTREILASPVSIILPNVGNQSSSSTSATERTNAYSSSRQPSAVSRVVQSDVISRYETDLHYLVNEEMNAYNAKQQCQVNGFRPFKQKTPLQRVRDVTQKRIHSQLNNLFRRKSYTEYAPNLSVQQRWPSVAENISYPIVAQSARPMLDGDAMQTQGSKTRRQFSSKRTVGSHNSTVNMVYKLSQKGQGQSITVCHVSRGTNSSNDDDLSRWEELMKRRKPVPPDAGKT